MALFMPKVMFEHITDIEPEFFIEHGIKALVLDIDNTLTTHDNPIPHEGIIEWVGRIKEIGIHPFVISNNSAERVAPFAKKIGLDFIPDAKKPLTFGITKMCKKFNFSKKETAIIGDQIFTDIMAGNLKGILTVLVTPYEPENGWFFKLKRKLEKPIIRNFYKKRRSR